MILVTFHKEWPEAVSSLLLRPDEYPLCRIARFLLSLCASANSLPPFRQLSDLSVCHNNWQKVTLFVSVSFHLSESFLPQSTSLILSKRGQRGRNRGDAIRGSGTKALGPPQSLSVSSHPFLSPHSIRWLLFDALHLSSILFSTSRVVSMSSFHSVNLTVSVLLPIVICIASSSLCDSPLCVRQTKSPLHINNY